jgi:hypothetical protein
MEGVRSNTATGRRKNRNPKINKTKRKKGREAKKQSERKESKKKYTFHL